jgi:hypothetical protein
MRATNDILRDFAEQLIHNPFIDGSKEIGKVLIKILDEEKERNNNALKSRLKK